MTTATITDIDLNKAYEKLNEVDKSKLDVTMPYIIWINDRPIEFNFDQTIGKKGAWILASNVEIDFTEESDDFDYHL